MDYKKILAATTVTSAAIVVPVVAQAATLDNDLLEGTVGDFNDVIIANSVALNGEKITKYEWHIGPIGATPVQTSNSPQFKVPYSAHGQTVNVVATTATGAFEDSIAINSFVNTSELEKIPSVTSSGADFRVNDTIKLKDNNKKYVKFEWFILEGNEAYFIQNENDVLLDIPPIANGKSIFLVSTDDAGVKYYSTPISVAPLAFDQINFDLKINGNEITTTNSSLAPNDLLSVDSPELKITDGEYLLNSQYTVSYQWYLKDGGSRHYISDATNSSYQVPKDADEHKLEGYGVEVTVSIPDVQLTSGNVFYIEVANLNMDPAKNLSEGIEFLFDTDPTIKSKSKYKLKDKDTLNAEFNDSYTGFARFESYINFLLSKYEVLSTNSKAAVKNYKDLQEAYQNVQVVSPLIKQLEVFEKAKLAYDINKTEIMHKELVKKIETIRSQYQKLTALQRSILELTDFGNSYINKMHTMLTNSTEDGTGNTSSTNDSTMQLVNGINEDILGLFHTISIVKTYSLATIDKEGRKDFLDTVNTLNNQAKKIDKLYQPMIYTTLLKTAIADVKVVNKFLDEVNNLSKYTETKRIQKADSLRKKFNKFTSSQKSLIGETTDLALLNNSYSNEDARITNLKKLINDLITPTSYNVPDSISIPVNPNDSSETVEYTFADAIDYILENYKTLSSDGKLKIDNYNAVKQAQKDVKAANNVISLFNKAIILDNDTNPDPDDVKALKPVYTKYKAAFNAYKKLTSMQRTIIDNSDYVEGSFSDIDDRYKELSDLINDPNFDESVENQAELFDENKSDSVSASLTKLEAIITGQQSDTLQSVQEELEAVQQAYKSLTSYEKKNVYNYSLLSNIKKVVTKVNTVDKQLKTAIASTNKSKLSKAIEAYNKLTSGQKVLIENTYTTAANLLYGDVAYSKNEIDNIFGKFEGQIIIEVFEVNDNDLNKILESYSAKDLKKSSNYKYYEEAVKNKKAVEALVKKMELLNLPKFSQKESIIKAFNKLNANQQYMFDQSAKYKENRDQLEQWIIDVSPYEGTATVEAWDNNASITHYQLNARIGNLLVSGNYNLSNTPVTGTDMEFIKGMTEYINQLQAKYKKFDSKERKLVTNYSILKSAETDAKAVKNVIELAMKFDTVYGKEKENVFNQWERLYNRLTTTQLDLYEKSGDVQLTNPTTTP